MPAKVIQNGNTMIIQGDAMWCELACILTIAMQKNTSKNILLKKFKLDVKNKLTHNNNKSFRDKLVSIMQLENLNTAVGFSAGNFEKLCDIIEIGEKLVPYDKKLKNLFNAKSLNNDYLKKHLERANGYVMFLFRDRGNRSRHFLCL
jgi:hypothetical protein